MELHQLANVVKHRFLSLPTIYKSFFLDENII
jgi:hypothetical protein